MMWVGNENAKDVASLKSPHMIHFVTMNHKTESLLNR